MTTREIIQHKTAATTIIFQELENWARSKIQLFIQELLGLDF